MVSFPAFTSSGQVAKEEGIECKFKPTDGYLFPLTDEKEHADTLDKELAAARRAGLVDVSKVPAHAKI